MKPKISFLISTLGKNPKTLHNLLNDLSKQTLKNFEVVIVAQISDKSNEDVLRKTIGSVSGINHLTLIVSNSLGLSKSRNVALRHGNGEMLIFCDDDCRYPTHTAQTVANDMLRYPEFDILTYQISFDPNGRLFKDYPHNAIQHTVRSLMKVSSIEITIRKNVVEKEGDIFDERYGLGTSNRTGAENIMLLDLYKKGYLMAYLPKPIVYHPRETSAHGKLNIEDIAFAKGAMFRRMFGIVGVVPAIYFVMIRLSTKRKLKFSVAHFIPLLKGVFTSN
jgi:glycosyltransferase involved in cell wall biosynthesis